MRRLVLSEMLDDLAEEDPAALANRRDLRRLNTVMRNFAWIRKTLTNFPETRSMNAVEWAAGDGGLGRQLHRSGTRQRMTGVDRWSRPSDWPGDWPWWQGNLQDWSAFPQHPVVLGNLILHQFKEETLACLGQSLNQHASVLIFNETLRSRTALILAKCLGLAGAHPVTRHDALVSVRAGFRNTELPSLLQLDPSRWRWDIQTTFLGAYRMVARKREDSA